MKKWFLSVLITSLAMPPVYAQWQAKALRGLAKRNTAAFSTRTLATQRAINQALKQSSSPAGQLVKSTLTLRLGYLDEMKASAFVFEEKYKGKTYLWGATATHYYLQEPALENAQGQAIPVEIVAQGHPGRNDVALFLIPAQFQHSFKPLQLATHGPREGDKLLSAGYFDDDFHVEKGRRVINIFPTRVITSLKIEDKLAREGACGGPVLNKRGQLVGMHVGSSDKHQAGFVVPVEYIYEVLQAYHHNGVALQPLYFNGRKLDDINVNEYVKSMEVWSGGKQLEDFQSFPYRAFVDYNHLEKFVNIDGADKIVLIIERIPFSSSEKDQRYHQFKLTYDLRTLQVSKRKKQ